MNIAYNLYQSTDLHSGIYHRPNLKVHRIHFMMDSIFCYNVSGSKLSNKQDTLVNWFHIAMLVPLTGKHQFKWFDFIEMLHEWLVISGNCPIDSGYNCHFKVTLHTVTVKVSN